MTAMDSTSFEGFVLDPAKCSKLSMEEKRELVYEISKWSNGAPELLQSWSRQDILQILCAEMGKERKYTGLTKLKIIENLLKVVSEKTSLETDHESQPSSQRVPKRQRKTDHPNRLPPVANNIADDNDLVNNLYCKNSACKAKLGREDRFCKRCSCCICYQFDDNKDPSLWLTCSSDPPFEGNNDSCGLSCHLECALKEGRSGISKNVEDIMGLDGNFYCVSCGKVNDLLGCWRKQMITARDTRRVDILCYRVSLGQKLLSGTKHYQKLYGIVDEALKKLEEEVGPLSGLPVKKARGIVNRLSSGHEVQRLCAFAVDSLDFMLSDTPSNLSSAQPLLLQGTNMVAPLIRFENVGTSSLTVNLGSEGLSQENGVGYTLWHRMTDETDYSAEPTCTLFAPNTRFSISNLTPATEYHFKVVSFNSTGEFGTREVRFQTCSDDNDKVSNPKNTLKLERSHSPVTNCSSLSNPSSVEDENNNNSENQKGKLIIAYSEKTEDIAGSVNGQCGTQGDSLSIMDKEPNIGSMPNGNVDLESKEDYSPENQTVEEISTENDSNTLVQSGLECVPFAGSSDTALPVTPCKLEETLKDAGPGRKIRSKNRNKAVDKDGSGGREEEPQDGGSSKKRCIGERPGEECAENGDRDFGYYVKVIRRLECDGHIETSFRQKFLTWYSLRATPQEMRIVKVFVDTLIDDPASLAGQLVDTFSDVISNKRSSSVVPMGLCLRLWH